MLSTFIAYPGTIFTPDVDNLATVGLLVNTVLVPGKNIR
jgi:hypothetical protein